MEARKTIIKRIKEWLRQWSNKFRDVQATYESDLRYAPSRQVAGIKGMTIIYCSDHVCWNGKWHPACWLFLSQCPILLDLTLDTTTIWAASHSLEYDLCTKRESLRRCATHLGMIFSATVAYGHRMIEVQNGCFQDFCPKVPRHWNKTPIWSQQTHPKCSWVQGLIEPTSNVLVLTNIPPAPPSYWKLNWQCDGTLSALKEVRRHIILEKGVSHL